MDRGVALSGGKSFLVGGDCLTRFENALDSKIENLEFLPPVMQIDPVKLARFGMSVFEKNGSQTEPMHPVYLRDADVSLPKNPPRQLEAEKKHLTGQFLATIFCGGDCFIHEVLKASIHQNVEGCFCRAAGAGDIFP